MSQEELTLSVGVIAIVVATATNGLVKTAVSTIVGGAAMGLRVGVPLVTSAIAGLVVAWLATTLW